MPQPAATSCPRRRASSRGKRSPPTGASISSAARGGETAGDESPSESCRRIVVTEALSTEALAWLGERFELAFVEHGDEDRLGRELATAEGLVVRTYTKVDDRLLARAPRLRVAGRAGVGLDNFDLDACRRRGVQVVYTPDANSQAVVEYVLALVLDAERPRTPLPERASPLEFHRQRKELVGRELAGRTLGILGLGRIGKRLARVGDALGMRVLWNDLLTARELGLPADAPGIAVDKATLWAESDVLTIHTDGRSSNRRLIDRGVLAAVKPSCFFVNAARGMLVDPAALADWARRHAGDGARAVVDVHDPEPPAADSPLWGLANLRMQAHLASRTEAALARMSWVVRDVVRVLDGEAPEFPADSGTAGATGRTAAAAGTAGKAGTK